MRKSSAIIMVVALVVAGVAVALIVGNMNKSTPAPTNNQSQPSASNTTESANNSSQNSTGSAVAATAVTIQDMAFSPATIKVKVGDTVTWTNQDSTSHTVTADSTSADAPDSPTLSKGDTYKFTFNKAGTYKYHCTFHSFMTGTVIVE